MFSLTRCGRAFRAISIGIGASIGLLGASGIAIARDSRDSTPDAAPGSPLTITLSGADGGEIGTATFSKAVGAVVIDVSVTGLEPGDHGIHSHETGTCDANGNEPFASAGGTSTRTASSMDPARRSRSRRPVLPRYGHTPATWAT